MRAINWAEGKLSSSLFSLKTRQSSLIVLSTIRKSKILFLKKFMSRWQISWLVGYFHRYLCNTCRYISSTNHKWDWSKRRIRSEKIIRTKRLVLHAHRKKLLFKGWYVDIGYSVRFTLIYNFGNFFFTKISDLFCFCCSEGC